MSCQAFSKRGKIISFYIQRSYFQIFENFVTRNAGSWRRTVWDNEIVSQIISLSCHCTLVDHAPSSLLQILVINHSSRGLVSPRVRPTDLVSHTELQYRNCSSQWKPTDRQRQKRHREIEQDTGHLQMQPTHIVCPDTSMESHHQKIHEQKSCIKQLPTDGHINH